MKKLHIATWLTTTLTTAATAHAQSYPSKPIKAIVPFAAGSATDQIGRAFAQKMSEQLGQPIIIENKAGVSGMLGADAVAKSAPDGYTLMVGTNSTNAALKSLMKKLPYDQDTAFAPTGHLGPGPPTVARQQRWAGQEPQGTGRDGQGQAHPAHVRQRQHIAARVHRSADEHDGHSDDTHPLQKRSSRHDRPDRRSGQSVHRRLRRHLAPGQSPQDPRSWPSRPCTAPRPSPNRPPSTKPWA